MAMEKLFIKIILVLLVSQIISAQDSLYVYRVNGSVYKNNDTKTLRKGNLIYKKDILILSENSQLIAIDNIGSIFEINKKGKYTYSRLLKNIKETETSGLTTKYFKFIWSELAHEKEKKTTIAGVFRGPVLMKYPPDKAFVSFEILHFKWQDDKQPMHYIFIHNIKEDITTKFETKAQDYFLYPDNDIFKNSKEYEWTVTTDGFPNLKNIPFYHFTILKSLEYLEMIKNYQPLIDQLKTLGLSNEEIEQTICDSYGVCKEEEVQQR